MYISIGSSELEPGQRRFRMEISFLREYLCRGSKITSARMTEMEEEKTRGEDYGRVRSASNQRHVFDHFPQK